jgi:hypothetical protein
MANVHLVLLSPQLRRLEVVACEEEFACFCEAARKKGSGTSKAFG